MCNSFNDDPIRSENSNDADQTSLRHIILKAQDKLSRDANKP